MGASTNSKAEFNECDFCTSVGEIGKNIFCTKGWRFCKRCKVDIEIEIKNRRENRAQGKVSLND